MRDDEKFEIIRALDLLPHISGASWAMLWFRVNGIKNPSKDEFREKTVEYFSKIVPLLESFEGKKEFEDINHYMKNRFEEEKKLIMSGENSEVEKRYQRYLDYGLISFLISLRKFFKIFVRFFARFLPVFVFIFFSNVSNFS